MNVQWVCLRVKHLFISEWTGFTHGFYFPLSLVNFQPQIETKVLITLSLLSAGWYCQLVIHKENWRESFANALKGTANIWGICQQIYLSQIKEMLYWQRYFLTKKSGNFQTACHSSRISAKESFPKLEYHQKCVFLCMCPFLNTQYIIPISDCGSQMHLSREHIPRVLNYVILLLCM